MTHLPSVQVRNLNSRLSLRKNFTWTFAGNMVYAASQWGVLVLLAKLGSTEIVGQFALGLAITAPVIMFSNLQLRSVQATDARHEYSFADYLGLRLITTLAADLIIVGIVLLSGYRQDTALVILLIGLAKSFEAVSDIFFGLLQRHERMDRIAKSLMIEGPITLGVMAVILYLTHSIVWAAGGMALVWGLQLVLYDLRSGILLLRARHPDEWRQLLRPRFRRITLQQLSWLALPLGFVAMLISLNANIPRYFIERFLGKDQLGIFAALAYLMTAGTTIVAALGQSASPRLAKYYSLNDHKSYWKLLSRLLGIGVTLGGLSIFVAIVLGTPILTFFYGTEYARYIDVFVLVLVASAFNYTASFLGYGITAARYFRTQIPLFLFIAITTALVSWILIPSIGLRGAALALIVSTVVQIMVSAGIVCLALRSKQRPIDA